MEYHMLYVDSRKSFKARIKKTYYFMQLKFYNALNKLKLSNGSKKLPKFHMNQSILSIAYTKKF